MEKESRPRVTNSAITGARQTSEGGSQAIDSGEIVGERGVSGQPVDICFIGRAIHLQILVKSEQKYESSEKTSI